MSQLKKIGDRIRKVRKDESLTQEKFARRLGVKGGYISTLETHRNDPSEQLILNICRTFGVNYEWLKKGMDQPEYEIGFRFSGLGRDLTERILRVFESPEEAWSLWEIAEILNIDPYDPSKKLNLPSDFREAVLMVMRIFYEGDHRKIQAVMSQLQALVPEGDLEALMEKLKVDKGAKNMGEDGPK